MWTNKYNFLKQVKPILKAVPSLLRRLLNVLLFFRFRTKRLNSSFSSCAHDAINGLNKA